MKKQFPWKVYLFSALVVIGVAALIVCCTDIGDYLMRKL